MTVIFHNLAVAVITGVVLSALAFARESAVRIRARWFIDQNGIKQYEIFGSRFFRSYTVFNEKFDVVNGLQEVIIDFNESSVVDHSAIEAIDTITKRCHKVGKKVHLRHFCEYCRTFLDNASAIIDVNYWENPNDKVVVDKLEAQAP